MRLVLTGLVLLLCGSSARAQAAATDAWPADNPLPKGALRRLGSAAPFQAEYQGAAALSPDGKYLAVTNSSQSVTLYDLKARRRLLQASATGTTTGYQPLVAFSADAKKLAFGGFGNVTVIEVPGGKVVRQLQTRSGPGFYRGQSLALSADGTLVTVGTDYTGNQQQKPQVWEVATGKSFGPYDVVQNGGVWTALSPDGSILATGGRHFARGAAQEPDPPQTLQLWDVRSAKELQRFKVEQPFTQINAAAFSPDGKLVAAASGMSTFHLIDVATGRELRRFAGRRGQAQSLTFSSDGKTLLAGGTDGGLQAWLVDGGERVELAAAPAARLVSLGFPAPGKILALGAIGQALTWWDALSGEVGYAPHGHHLPILALAFSGDGRSLISAGGDGQVLTWDTANGDLQRRVLLTEEEFFRSPASIRYSTIALSGDGRLAAAGSNYGTNTVRLWDLTRSRVVCDFEASRASQPLGLVFTPQGDRLAATGAVQGGSVWNTGSGQEIARVVYGAKENHGGNSPRPALSPDGGLLAVPATWFDRTTGQQSSQILVFDVAASKELYTLPAPANSFQMQAAFSPDSKLLAVAAPGAQTALVKANSGQEWLRLRPDNGPALLSWLGLGTDPAQQFLTRSALAFSPDGRNLAVAQAPQQVFDFAGRPTGSAEATIEMWEVASGGLRQRFTGHRGQINSLVFSASGATLASGATDTTVLLWDTSGKVKTAALSPAEREEAWSALEKTSAVPAYRVMGKLLGAPADALALFKDKLRPAPPPEADRNKIKLWIADLDSDSFARRDSAYRGLERLGRVAEFALREALHGELSIEARRRIVDLLAKLDRVAPGPKELQLIRAVEVLEHLDVPEARAQLAALAQGADEALLTQEARRALGRLAR